jgi:hypothetical protein
MVFKLLEAAQKSWRRLDGHNQLPKLVLGATFNNGIEVIAKPADRQPKTADDIWLVRNDHEVVVGRRPPGNELAKRLRASIILVWRNHGSALSEVGCGGNLAKAQQRSGVDAA